MSEREKAILDQLEKEDVAELAVQLADIDSPVGQEGNVLEYVYGWMEQEGFSPRKVGMLPDRYNVVGRLPGTGRGHDLLFNSHVDTPLARTDTWISPNVTEEVFHSAWRDEDRLVGYGIVNDKGPLAATLIAAKAIRDSGVELAGDVILTAVSSETSKDPVDDLQPPEYYSREIGAQYLVTHGILADYALVAEATSRAITWVECGILALKLTVSLPGKYAYIPFLTRPTTLEESPNAIVRIAPVIEAFEKWAYDYQNEHRQVFDPGEVIPKTSIVGVRGGDPTSPGAVIGVCSLYVKCYLPPGLQPLEVVRSLEARLEGSGLSVEVEPYAYNPGAVADGIGPLKEAVADAHRYVFNEPLQELAPEVTSMWRDCNVFNNYGIPSLTYGPGQPAGRPDLFSLETDELFNFSRSYALVALNICSNKR